MNKHWVLISALLGALLLNASSAFAKDSNQSLSLTAFINQYANQESKDIVLRSPPEGDLMIVSKHSVNRITPEEFHTGLLAVGYYPVSENTLINIVPLQDIKSSNLPTYNGTVPDDLPDYKVINLILPIRNQTAMELVPTLRPLVPRWGHLAGMGSSNSLLLTTDVAGARKIVTIVSNLESAAGS